MKKKWIAVIGSGALVIGIAVAGASFADSDETEIRNGTIRIENQSEAEFPSMAKISMDQAVQNALASVQGQVLKTELEDENGFLVYGIEVVSAGTGKVLAMDRDKRLVLRLWPADITIGGADTPLFLGTMEEQDRHQLAGLITLTRDTGEYNRPLNELRQTIQSRFPVKSVSRTGGEIHGSSKHKRLSWGGQVLLVGSGFVP